MNARTELPRLDLLRTFEAAARSLSFTKAADELFLTQSAVSKQMQLLESELGLSLFERRHRALSLTEAGVVLHRATTDCMERLRDAAARMRGLVARRQVSVTMTPGFASLWLIPRLEGFTAAHPLVDVRISATHEWLDIERDGIDLAVRFCPIDDDAGLPLFEESVQPMCSPRLLKDKSNPLKKPADLANHTLLAVDMPAGMALTVDWAPWFAAMAVPEMKMKNSVRFTQYADAVAAAVAGQGVVIGRLPLLKDLVADRRLVAPFKSAATSRRGYFLAMSSHGRRNDDARGFADWLVEQAQRLVEAAPA
jgi:LysR family glycine cleavage system transcriptional activator